VGGHLRRRWYCILNYGTATRTRHVLDMYIHYMYECHMYVCVYIHAMFMYVCSCSHVWMSCMSCYM
jgi:hypothetical protein